VPRTLLVAALFVAVPLGLVVRLCVLGGPSAAGKVDACAGGGGCNVPADGVVLAGMLPLRAGVAVVRALGRTASAGACGIGQRTARPGMRARGACVAKPPAGAVTALKALATLAWEPVKESPVAGSAVAEGREAGEGQGG